MARVIEKILLVDTDVDFLNSMEPLLQFMGYTVVRALSTGEAVAKIRSEAPDVMILEYDLPETGGSYFCDSLRYMDLYIPTVMVSLLFDQEKYLRDARSAGFNWCLIKPPEMEQLEAVLREVAESLPEEKKAFPQSDDETRKNILILEDDESDYSMVKEFLTHRNYRVLWAQDTMQALSRARSSAVDLIIMEVMLNGENGLTLLDRLRKSDLEIPIVILSRLEPLSYAQVAESRGITHFLKKPLRQEELEPLLDVLMKEHPGKKKVSRKKFEDKIALVLEDNEDDYRVLSRFLVNEGFTIVRARDVSHALSRARSEKIDLIIMEIVLKNESGFILCDRLKSFGISIPTIILTELEPLRFQQVALYHGIKYSLQKPFTDDTLRDFIDDILS